MENKEKFKKLMQDEEFVTKLLELQTPEEVQAEFKSNGVALTMEEVREVIKELDTISEYISEEGLENISGGVNLPGSDVVNPKELFFTKLYEELGKGTANMMWIIPTVALSTVVTTTIGYYLKKGLDNKKQKKS